ncbi:hypothetical protein ACFQO9_11380 [Chryseobacterium zhengzhouense]|uniref:Lipoprotein n=1 Tax=Chryseobacterium zhengzhouense TaxID=1636086 RepID=A0ABW2LZL0_9FLAO
MKVVLIILSFCLILGCKTKRVSKIKTSEIITEQAVITKKLENKIEKVEQKQDEKKTSVSEQKKENQTEIEIKGKAEVNKPIELYNIENGDTLQSIKVTGNADVYIRSKNSKSDQLKKESTSSETSNKIEELAKKIVNEDILKKTGKEINQSAKESVTRTGTFWSFGLIGGLGAFALLLVAAFIYFKKYRK